MRHGDEPVTVKCVRCSRPIQDGALVVFNGGELTHVRCLKVIKSEDLLRESQALIRRSRQLIAHGRERLAQAEGPGEPPDGSPQRLEPPDDTLAPA